MPLSKTSQRSCLESPSVQTFEACWHRSMLARCRVASIASSSSDLDLGHVGKMGRGHTLPPPQLAPKEKGNFKGSASGERGERW